MRNKGRVIILSGPSGAGKTTLHNMILGSARFKGRITRSISATTRPPRAGERHGRDYFFLSEAMFRYKARAGHFLEWARVFGNGYGTPAKPVRGILRSGKSVLLCIDVQGAKEVFRKCPDALTVFVKTPTLDDLRLRLIKRGTDPKEIIEARIRTAVKELREAGRYQHVIVNNDLKKAYAELEDIFLREI